MPTLDWVRRGGRDCMRLRAGPELPGAIRSLDPADLAERFPVYPAALVASGADLPAKAAVPGLLQPMAGTYAIEDRDSIVFTPRFPFVSGAGYAMVLVARDLVGGRSRDGAPAVVTLHRPASASTPVTSVVEIHPAGHEVPRNLLRAYVEFSGPMSEGRAASCVSVSDVATGEPLAGALLAGPELWDPRRRRLTVLFDPARIKRGLIPQVAAGYPLVQGRQVELVVDEAFADAAGRPLVHSGRRRYRVAADLRGRVDPRSWVVTPPSAGTTTPLVVELGRPLDHALLARCLVLLDPEGQPVAGRTAVSDAGLSWALAPERPWAAASYQLIVDPVLEDIAGNSVRRVFDRDLDRREDDPITEARLALRIPVW